MALWGLARIAIKHYNVPEVYTALREGLGNRHADVRFTMTDLILNAYLDSQREGPDDVVAKLHEMAASDPDNSVRVAAKRYLEEPWAEE